MPCFVTTSSRIAVPTEVPRIDLSLQRRSEHTHGVVGAIRRGAAPLNIHLVGPAHANDGLAVADRAGLAEAARDRAPP